MRFLAILFLAIWLGSIFFFAAVLAPTVFHVLPTHTMAGNVVFPALSKLHLIGAICGVLFIVIGVIVQLRRFRHPAIELPELGLVLLMLILTGYAQFGIGNKMNGMRLGMGDIDAIAPTDARRVEFNHLHTWTTRVEGAIFFLGLGTLFLTSRRLS